MQLPEARKQIEDILLNLSETIVKTTIANMFETWDCAEKKSSRKLDTPSNVQKMHIALYLRKGLRRW